MIRFLSLKTVWLYTDPRDTHTCLISARPDSHWQTFTTHWYVVNCTSSPPPLAAIDTWAAFGLCTSIPNTVLSKHRRLLALSGHTCHHGNIRAITTGYRPVFLRQDHLLSGSPLVPEGPHTAAVWDVAGRQRRVLDPNTGKRIEMCALRGGGRKWSPSMFFNLSADTFPCAPLCYLSWHTSVTL